MALGVIDALRDAGKDPSEVPVAGLTVQMREPRPSAPAIYESDKLAVTSLPLPWVCIF